MLLQLTVQLPWLDMAEITIEFHLFDRGRLLVLCPLADLDAKPND